jgi:NTP pyrophosphatase (non-canonical NTP hydrolase)
MGDVTKDIEYLQRPSDIVQWHRRNFPGTTSAEQMLVVVQEVGELAKAEQRGTRFPSGEWETNLREEVGDALIALHAYCGIRGIDLFDCLADRWATVRKRRY